MHKRHTPDRWQQCVEGGPRWWLDLARRVGGLGERRNGDACVGVLGTGELVGRDRKLVQGRGQGARHTDSGRGVGDRGRADGEGAWFVGAPEGGYGTQQAVEARLQLVHSIW